MISGMSIFGGHPRAVVRPCKRREQLVGRV